MGRKFIPLALLMVCLTPLWGKMDTAARVLRQPSSAFRIGPGTVTSVHIIDLPFGGRRFAIKYQTDRGEMIEVWHPADDSPVLKGMYGMLTYSTNPEMVVNFQVMQQKNSRLVQASGY
jgi:hypothetical protein